MTPEQLANQLLARLSQAQDVADELFEGYADDVRAVEQSVTHVKTGALRDSETVFGPFRLGDVLEARIVPVDITYAEIEASRGADHNFAAKAIAESTADQARFRRNLERSVARLLGGR